MCHHGQSYKHRPEQQHRHTTFHIKRNQCVSGKENNHFLSLSSSRARE